MPLLFIIITIVILDVLNQYFYETTFVPFLSLQIFYGFCFSALTRLSYEVANGSHKMWWWCYMCILRSIMTKIHVTEIFGHLLLYGQLDKPPHPTYWILGPCLIIKTYRERTTFSVGFSGSTLTSIECDLPLCDSDILHMPYIQVACSLLQASYNLPDD